MSFEEPKMKVSDSTAPKFGRKHADEVIVIDDQAESSFSASNNKKLKGMQRQSGSVTSTSTKTSSISSAHKTPKKIRYQNSSDSADSDYSPPKAKKHCVPTALLNLLLAIFWCFVHLALAVYITIYDTSHYVIMSYFLFGFICYVILIIGNRIRLPHLYVFAYMYTSMTLIMLSFVLVSCIFMDFMLLTHGEPYDELGVVVKTDDFWKKALIFEVVVAVLCVAKWFTLRKMFHDYSAACARHWNQRLSKKQQNQYNK
ncbi:unnamed protein product [Bursaphelenchus okinawaensis]|uniref:Uncharacterized protein n=1 Tax=Bursaphelenchus okinawaensis TaxID=465554 RepID=A0A811JQM1_9BILA|nr:unnamed protein product [Bursaphelenchus okinawaensis]CAG9078686.1 unnamed protein product [Bursaphelenchus okinawaensis]